MFCCSDNTANYAVYNYNQNYAKQEQMRNEHPKKRYENRKKGSE